MPTIENARFANLELEVELDATPERAWEALTRDIDQWWLADFRATGEKSVVRLEPRAGGVLVEISPDGTELLWYTVQMVEPGSTLYLVGHTAADWGGPRTSMLKLSLKPHAAGSVLAVSDSMVGRISDSQLADVADGWRSLFGTALKEHVAAGD